MRSWPKSLPDYQWPKHFTSNGFAAVRWLLAATFHACYVAGVALSMIYRRRRGVLVIRTDGMGDAILFEPALESLARCMSPRSVHLWAPASTCELMQFNPAIRRMLAIPRGFKDGNLKYFTSFAWRARMGFEIGRWTFERVIYPAESPEPMGNWLFGSVRARERWVNFGDTTNQFDWQQTSTHVNATLILENRPGQAHELHRNEHLAVQWGEQREIRSPKVHIKESIAKDAAVVVDGWRLRARQRGASEIVGVVPAGSLEINSYPNAQWGVALSSLWEHQRVMPILLGGPSDRAALDALETELLAANVPYQKMSHPVSILMMAALIGKLDGLLSVDTGLAHFGVSQNVSTVVLSTGGTPGRFFPWPSAPHHQVLSVATSCAGCNNRCTQPEAICLTEITPEQIIGAYARLKGRRIALEVYIAPAVAMPLAG